MAWELPCSPRALGVNEIPGESAMYTVVLQIAQFRWGEELNLCFRFFALLLHFIVVTTALLVCDPLSVSGQTFGK